MQLGHLETKESKMAAKMVTGKYAPFELKLGTFLVNVHVSMPRKFQPDLSTFLCMQLGHLETKESKMAAKMVNRKICSV